MTSTDYGTAVVPNDNNDTNHHLNISNNLLHRHLSLFDLVCVGVGATGESDIVSLSYLCYHIIIMYVVLVS